MCYLAISTLSSLLGTLHTFRKYNTLSQLETELNPSQLPTGSELLHKSVFSQTVSSSQD